MAQFCPLCGKSKLEEALFCDDCKDKIEKEYEVNVPEGKRGQDTAEAGRDAVGRKLTERSVEVNKTNPDLPTDILSKDARLRKNKSRLFWGLLLLGILLVAGGFFYYGETVKKNNLDRLQWDMAMKENSVSGYLTYMKVFPRGKYYILAEENLVKLKNNEAETWKTLQSSDNRAELRNFLTLYPESPYIPLVKIKLDSLTWVATLNDNTAESYSDYMVASQSGELPGDYFGYAQARYDMLFQSYPVTKSNLDSIRLTVDGFFTALSALNANEITKYMAPVVFRFFNFGGGQREKIVGDLLISVARTQAPTVQFLPNTAALAYEKTETEHYKVNVPVQKSYVAGGQQKNVSGYIVQLELDRNFRILALTERKPADDAV